MKITTILKQGFALFFGVMILAICEFSFISYIGFSPKGSPNSEDGLILLLFTIVCILWGIYRAMCEHYGNLERAPLYGLGLLLIASGVSNVFNLVNFFQGAFLLDPTFFTCLFKKGSLLAYVCAFQLALAEIVLLTLLWSITFYTFQALKKKISDKNNRTQPLSSE